mmetsp:Transcript_42081/g.62300  ORF Transcript_42081/g.62300 Transcript_42081/m.62300 type:complete len:273 (-) Transcript_42081:3802-4620(-)
MVSPKLVSDMTSRIVAATLLPIYRRSPRMFSSATNSAMSSASVSGFSCSSPSIELAESDPLMELLRMRLAGRPRTDKQRLSICENVAQVSSEMFETPKSFETKSCNRRSPLTAKTAESDNKHVLSMAKISSTRLSSLKTPIDLMHNVTQPSMKDSKVVSIHVVSRSSGFNGFGCLVEKRTKSFGSAGFGPASASTSACSSTGVRTPRKTSRSVCMASVESPPCTNSSGMKCWLITPNKVTKLFSLTSFRRSPIDRDNPSRIGHHRRSSPLSD